jgi:hypothetical protein
MKTLEFKRNSWHYFLATKVGDYDEDSNDFCSYVRNFILGGAFLAAMSGVMLFLLYAIGRECYAFYTCFFTKACTYGSFESGFAIFVAIIALVVLIIWFCCWNGNRLRERRWAIEEGRLPQPKPSFVKTAYKSFKEKTCFRVEFI